MSKYKLAFFDIDGTLIDPKIDQTLSLIERTPKSAQQAIHLLREKGITPIIATGRGVSYIKQYVADLAIDSYITSNGQNVVYQGKEIYRRFLTAEQIENAIQVLDEMGLDYWYEMFDKRIFIPQSEQANMAHDGDVIIGEKTDYIGKDITQIIVHSERVRDLTFNIPGLVAKVVAPIAINILPADVSKATAIEVMLDILKINKNEVLAFGDEENDLEMFSAVGTPVAMGNAIADLKAKAAYVTTNVDDDGIYNACKALKLF